MITRYPARAMPRALVMISTLLLVLVAAGCFGDLSNDEYQTKVTEARDRTDSALADMTKATTLDDLIERLRFASDEAIAAADELEDAGSPSALEEEAQELTDALRALGDEVLATADALDEGEFEGSSIQGLEFENWDRTQSALDDLRNAGIDVQPLERY